ncbi:cytochrome c oxidase assembly protein COX20, mitochondrial [Phlebotomus papatasi]|uniref:Cytochrome c oxidase assembly protein COX20, mitochondrial n=1 Tax=Phlebotomus papatasi TaxID=29031 RepID=A0A1B0D5Q5_PHLPP|nr:cytochrome c oxidase assembly protein COX20, mitochondrial [Phlebotomus papatasi]
MSDDTDEYDEPNHKSLMIFGRDVSQIPCFRQSFLYGISGGIAAGFATFLFTSRTRLSSHAAVAFFCFTTLGYWSQCRYNWSKTKFEYNQLKRGMQEYAMYEGTDLAKEVQKRGTDA